MNRSTTIRIAVACAVAIVVGGMAAAQDRPRPGARGGDVQKEPIRGAGTIKGSVMGGLHVVGGGGEQYLVVLDPNLRPGAMSPISFLGKAEESWLRPGMIVRFTATFDKKLRATEPVGQLDVITLREGMQIGVIADSGFGKPGAGLFQDAKPEKNQKKSAAPEGTPGVVIGRLADVRSGKLTINAGGKPIKIELDEGAKISVDVADLSFVRPGDKIEFQGWTYPGMKQNVMANQMTVTASQPLTHEKKKGPPAAEAKGKDAAEKGGDKP